MVEDFDVEQLSRLLQGLCDLNVLGRGSEVARRVVVAESVGLTTGTAISFYIQLYRGDKKLLLESLDAVRKAAGTILEGIEM